MSFEDQIHLSEAFIVATSIFTVALADAQNERLKTALSLAGALIAIAWFLCGMDADTGKEIAAKILYWLPLLALAGWIMSTCVHACKR